MYCHEIENTAHRTQDLIFHKNQSNFINFRGKCYLICCDISLIISIKFTLVKISKLKKIKVHKFQQRSNYQKTYNMQMFFATYYTSCKEKYKQNELTRGRKAIKSL